ncbi:MAG: hypothetical protein ACE5Q6_13925 [Dehalococcoidia bacterium]
MISWLLGLIFWPVRMILRGIIFGVGGCVATLLVIAVIIAAVVWYIYLR